MYPTRRLVPFNKRLIPSPEDQHGHCVRIPATASVNVDSKLMLSRLIWEEIDTFLAGKFPTKFGTILLKPKIDFILMGDKDYCFNNQTDCRGSTDILLNKFYIHKGLRLLMGEWVYDLYIDRYPGALIGNKRLSGEGNLISGGFRSFTISSQGESDVDHAGARYEQSLYRDYEKSKRPKRHVLLGGQVVVGILIALIGLGFSRGAVHTINETDNPGAGIAGLIGCTLLICGGGFLAIGSMLLMLIE
jgi:hypothetical protein